MANEIINKGSAELPAAQMINQGPGPQIGTMTGNIIYNQVPAGLVEQVNVIFGLLQGQQQNISHAMEWASLSHERFCLFVLDNETYNAGAFSIAKTRALTKYTPEWEHYKPLSPDLVAEILQMPCIFSKRNIRFRETSEDHPVIYGRIKEIIPQESTIKFCFEAYKMDYQQTINHNISRFGLLETTLRNQLDEEHWCIRNGNLQQVLSSLGVIIE